MEKISNDKLRSTCQEICGSIFLFFYCYSADILEIENIDPNLTKLNRGLLTDLAETTKQFKVSVLAVISFQL